MLNILVKFMLLAAVALASPLSMARDQAPDTMLNAAIAEVMSLLRHDKDLQAGNAAKVGEMVEAKLLPLFHVARMTQIVVARNWRLASPEQQAMLTAEFKTLLVRTYSMALANYRDHPIEFKRLRMAPGDTEVTVKSEVNQPGRERMTIDYDMENTPEGWKIYDIKLLGVSLIATYRDSFAEAVRHGGLNGLTGLASEDNRHGGASVWTGGAAPHGQSLIGLAMLYSALQGRR